MELWGNVLRAKVERRGASYPDYLDWRAQSKSFEDIAAFDNQTLTLAGAEDPERILVEFASAPYFSLLGVSAVRGRTFSAEEDLVATPVYVVVLSDGLWKRRFGADPQIVGRSVTLNTRAYTIVGVMPPGFKGLTDTAELWVPFAVYAPPQTMATRGNRGFGALARLKPGVTLAGAQSELDGISRQLERAYPDTNEKRGVEVSPLDVELFGALRPALLTLMAAVAFVLLIACANVANLLIARSEARRREIAVRTALGAGRGRLLRQLITESCVLTALGAGAGLLLARGAVAVLIAQSPVTFPSFVAPGLDIRVAAFTVAVSLACGMLVGLAPGLQARSVDLNSALKETARGSDGQRSQRLRNVLVVAELSMAVVLLIGAGLMIRSVRNLMALDPGFDPASILTLRVSIPRAPVPPSPAPPGAAQTPLQPVVQGRVLLERIRAVPGVTAVALGTDLPLDGNASASGYAAEGMPPTNAQNVPRAYTHRISPEFFNTLQIPIVSGRAFTEAEQTPTSPAVIVSERVVKRFWPGQDPIGKRVKFGSLTSPNPVDVDRRRRRRGEVSRSAGESDGRSRHLSSVRRSQLAVCARRPGDCAAVVARRAAARRSSERGSVDSHLPDRGNGRADQRTDLAVALHDVADGRVRRRGLVALGHRHLRRDVVSGDRSARARSASASRSAPAGTTSCGSSSATARG